MVYVWVGQRFFDYVPRECVCARERDREYVGTYVCDFANVYLERERDGGGGKTREPQTKRECRKGGRGIVYVCVTERGRGRENESARKRERVEGGREGDCVCV